MDIASKLTFELHAIKLYPYRQIIAVTNFSLSASKVWENEVISIDIEENEDINILFNSEDRDAKLYLEALDIVPSNDCEIDENGEIYRRPSQEEFILTKQASGYDALKVDNFEIKIFCDGQWFYGILRVLPKQMSTGEWQMMRNDLENEVRGLAQDIIRRNIGVGNVSPGLIPPELLYEFLVIKKYSRRILPTIVDIADNPRHEICTNYIIVPAINNSAKIDAETVKRYVVHSGSEAVLKVPQKNISYDIQDNRLLKKMINSYEKKLTKFIEALDNYAQNEAGITCTKNSSLMNGLGCFKITALKLKKMTSLLHTKDWYKSVSNVVQAHIPHSYILDARYNMFYQLHEELKRKTIRVEFDPAFSYTWKQSSKLYEIWCFVKICHILEGHFSMIDNNKVIFSENMLFPLLKDGSKVVFENDIIRLEVIYNAVLPISESKTNIHSPLASIRFNGGVPTHNKPDIVVNVYNKRKEWYIGSLILECKYRKLQSFWTDNLRSSREQLATYYNNARSTCLFGENGSLFNMRPVDCVFVLTPDLYGDGIIKSDFNIFIKSFRPTEDKSLEHSVEEELLKKISSLNKKLELWETK